MQNDNVLIRSMDFTAGKVLGEVVELTDTYFTSHKYKQQQNTDASQRIYSRVNRLGNGFVFDALKWQNTVTISFSPQDEISTYVNCTFNIDTTGQTVMDNEIKKWDMFIANYQASVQGGQMGDITAQQREVNHEVRHFLLKWVSIAVLASVATFGILLVIEKLLHINLHAPYITSFVTIVSIGMIMRKMQDEKSQNK